MIQKTTIVLYLSLLCSHLFAQLPKDRFPGPNLIENPGFEMLRRGIPQNDLDGSVAFRNSVKSWMSPTKTTPDLLFFINSEMTDGPKTGKSMVGILTHNPRSKRSDTYREYIQIRLKKPLIEGAEYYVEFWACRAYRSKMASNNLGVAVSPVPFMTKNFKPLLEIKPVVNEDKIINPKKKEWVRISGIFTASNRERFLIIGNFYNNENTKFIDAPLMEDNFNESYYLLDDVALHQLDTKKPEPAIIATEEIKVGATIRLDRIYFETAKWDLLPESNTELNELVDLLNQYPKMRIAIHGHTDSRGSNRYNQNLSENRAKAVFEYLRNNGIDLSRIEYKGFGETQPVDSNDTDYGRQNNRRVEFVVLDIGEENVTVED
ncbi:MAG TPA: OmpA family protein [Phaeodactylibacter sp.]|nr:OmpA family protein [Phaeodactylibacter sp.]